jgi:hypothetical protein
MVALGIHVVEQRWIPISLPAESLDKGHPNER